MNPLAKLHSHPNPGQPGIGKYTHKYGHQLEAGDELEATDVYSSTSGYWELCPCPGTKLVGGLAVVWVRPT